MKAVEKNELAAAVDRVEYLLMRGDSRPDVLDCMNALRKIVNRGATAGNSAQSTRDAGAADFEGAAFRLHQRAEGMRAGAHEVDGSFASRCLRDLPAADDRWKLPNRSDAAALLKEVWPRARRMLPLRATSVRVAVASGEEYEVVFHLNGRMQVRQSVMGGAWSQLVAESVAGYPWIPAECPHVAYMRSPSRPQSSSFNGSAA